MENCKIKKSLAIDDINHLKAVEGNQPQLNAELAMLKTPSAVSTHVTTLSHATIIESQPTPKYSIVIKAAGFVYQFRQLIPNFRRMLSSILSTEQ